MKKKRQCQHTAKFVPRVEPLEHRMLLTAISELHHRPHPLGPSSSSFHDSALVQTHQRMPASHESGRLRGQDHDARATLRSSRPDHSKGAKPIQARPERRGPGPSNPPPITAPPAATPPPATFTPQPAAPNSTPFVSASIPTRIPPVLPPAPLPSLPTTSNATPTPPTFATNLADATPTIRRPTIPTVTTSPTTTVSTSAGSEATARTTVPTATRAIPNVVPEPAPRAVATTAADRILIGDENVANELAFAPSNLPSNPVDDDESLLSSRHNNPYGGIIDFENQPQLQDTLPIPNGIVEQNDLSPLGTDKTLDESNSDTNEESELQRLLDPLSERTSETPEQDDDPTAIKSLKVETPEVSVPEPTTEEISPREIVFESYESTEAFGGIIDISPDLALADDQEFVGAEKSFTRDRALEVDTIIGQAPLLRLEPGEDDEVNGIEDTPEAEFDSAISTQAVVTTLLMMPWKTRRNERAKKARSQHVFFVD